MRENETRIGGQQWGLFSIFEQAEPRPGRVLDQSVVAWRLASKKTGSAAFENPRSVIQRTINMVTCGSNRANLEPGRPRVIPPVPERIIPIIYRRARVNSYYHGVPPYNPEELERFVVRSWSMMTAGEVRMQMEEERVRRLGYPTPEEVAEIQRRFYNPELVDAMELAQREYLAQMGQILSEPAPPGYREAMEAARNAD